MQAARKDSSSVAQKLETTGSDLAPKVSASRRLLDDSTRVCGRLFCGAGLEEGPSSHPSAALAGYHLTRDGTFIAGVLGLLARPVLGPGHLRSGH